MDQLWKMLWGEEQGHNLSEFALLLVLVGLLAASVAAGFGVTLSGACSKAYAAVTFASRSESGTATISNSHSSPSTEFGKSIGSGSRDVSGTGQRAGLAGGTR